MLLLDIRPVMTIMAMSNRVVLGRLTAASIILNMLLGAQPADEEGTIVLEIFREKPWLNRIGASHSLPSDTFPAQP